VGALGCGPRAYLLTDARGLEFRPVEPAPTGKSTREGDRFADPWWPPETLVTRPSAFGGEDLEAIVVRKRRGEEGKRDLTLYVRKESWDRVLDATVPLVGKRLGIVVDGKLAAAPALREPVFASIDLPVAESELDTFLEALPRGRPPRHPEEEITDWLEHRVALRGYDRAAMWRLADTYGQTGRCDQAVPLLEKMVEKERDPRLVLGRLGRCYRTLGRHADAIAVYERLLSSGSPALEWMVRLELGKSYEAEGDIAKAIVELERSLALVQDETRSTVVPESDRQALVTEMRRTVEQLRRREAP
jgi:tetratricopeptide (TPR) repeat protein